MRTCMPARLHDILHPPSIISAAKLKLTRFLLPEQKSVKAEEFGCIEKSV